MFCPKCGKALDQDDCFCPQCGVRIDDVLVQSQNVSSEQIVNAESTPILPGREFATKLVKDFAIVEDHGSQTNSESQDTPNVYDASDVQGGVFKKLYDARGRASRSEYWRLFLFLLVSFLLPTILLRASFGMAWNYMTTNYISGEPIRDDLPILSPLFVGALVVVWCVVFIVPSFCLVSRRLHDFGKSGGWSVLLFLTFIVPTANAPAPPGIMEEVNLLIVACLIVVVFLLTIIGIPQGTSGENKYDLKRREFDAASLEGKPRGLALQTWNVIGAWFKDPEDRERRIVAILGSILILLMMITCFLCGNKL